MPQALQDLLADYPGEVEISASDVSAAREYARNVLVVLDDDPTGTQSVADLPVLTSWEVDDFAWAFTHRIDGAPAPAVYVLTNSRSLDRDDAARRTRASVANAQRAADDIGIDLAFVSRSDSTLRGHYPLETDVIAQTLSEHGGPATDGVVLVPAFPDAGRVTIGGVHYVQQNDSLTPAAETEFADDATFGYTHSALADYVQEKTEGRVDAGEVIVLDLGVVRGGTDGIADAVQGATESTPIVVDIVTEHDLRALALGLIEAESRGTHLLYRVGPPFVRAMIGQDVRSPLAGEEVIGPDADARGGLVVVGSHVTLTTRQLDALISGHPDACVVELSVEALMNDREAHLDDTVEAVTQALVISDVILHTSRQLKRADDPDESLRIARDVSQGVVDVVRRTVAQRPPRFVVAKGGITSSDVASAGMQIRHAVVRGPMLPGLVSLWEAVDGPARGIPYVVFAGNVGADESLLDVVRTLRAYL
ncbi:MAG: four-carbon acid sugar kinase family protein [Ornithinimicrobium sp.]